MTDHESIESFLRNFFTWVYINLAIFTILLYDTRKSQGPSIYAYLTKEIVITADREVRNSIKTYNHAN